MVRVADLLERFRLASAGRKQAKQILLVKLGQRLSSGQPIIKILKR